MPQSCIFLILSCAPPFPPEIIAPACPMRLPGGAVTPAIKPTIGFFISWFFINSAASSSAVPPISPIIKIDSVSLSFKNKSKQSIKLVPLIGSPPIPMQVDCPSPLWNDSGQSRLNYEVYFPKEDLEFSRNEFNRYMEREFVHYGYALGNG